MQFTQTIGMLIGGLGLFMLAVTMISDGLRLAAGNALRDMLSKATRTPKHGILTGVAITALVQSSSAVTVATIGFVNAGLLNLYQALGVVYGANIGTTMTGWLVAAIGFQLKVESFALPLIGVGMILKLTGGDTRRAPLGLALAGFGLFFIGIDVLKDAFEGLVKLIDLQRFTVDGVLGVLLFFGIGFLMTVLTQSSSAAIAITLTAAAGGVVGIYAAAAMVIGANVGTTSTAAFAVIGATPNAKRVAAAHVVFNAGTGIVALIIMPILFWTVSAITKVFGLADVPLVTLALFHTVFNVLGVLLIWPVTRRLTQELERRFVTITEKESRPQYLDKNIAVSPLLAVNALTLELLRIASITRRMALAVLSVESGSIRRLAGDHIIVKRLSNAVADFITRLERGSLTEEVSEQLIKLLRVEQHLLLCANDAMEIARLHSKLEPLEEEFSKQVSHYRAEVVNLIFATDPEQEGFDLNDCEQKMTHIYATYNEVKAELLHAGAQLRTPIPGMIDVLEQNNLIRNMGREMLRATHYLSDLYANTRISSEVSKEKE